MRILVICESFGLGGTERAACVWAIGLRKRGHAIRFLAGMDGPRRGWLEKAGIEFFDVGGSSENVAAHINAFAPDVIHEHVPGFLRKKNLGLDGRRLASPTPVVQTNIFGRQDESIAYGASGISCYISNTSAVQSFWRARKRIERSAFGVTSVVSYPVLAESEMVDMSRVVALRSRLGSHIEFVIGRFGRPDWQKWSKLYEPICRAIVARHSHVGFLFQSAPRELQENLKASPIGKNCLFLQPTSDDRELNSAIHACDAILHLSRIGESFGFSIAEAMAAGKPVIVNSSPDFDQAQLELIRHGKEGYHASTVGSAILAINRLVGEPETAKHLGQSAKDRIMDIACAEKSTLKLEKILMAAAAGYQNPFSEIDYKNVYNSALALKAVELGGSWSENMKLRLYHLRGVLRNHYQHLRVK